LAGGALEAGLVWGEPPAASERSQANRVFVEEDKGDKDKDEGKGKGNKQDKANNKERNGGNKDKDRANHLNRREIPTITGSDLPNDGDDACSKGTCCTVPEIAFDAEDFAKEFGEPSGPKPLVPEHPAEQGTSILHCLPLPKNQIALTVLAVVTNQPANITWLYHDTENLPTAFGWTNALPGGVSSFIPLVCLSDG
jgi:hypothetical protein